MHPQTPLNPKPKWKKCYGLFSDRAMPNANPDSNLYSKITRLRKCEWHWCVLGCVSMHMFLWEGVSVFELQYISVNVSLCITQSLLTHHTVSSLTGLPEAEPNERISIWQQWILDCALTDGWISRDRASLQQDLHRQLRKCLRKGCSGRSGWARAVEQNMAAVMEYHPFN